MILVPFVLYGPTIIIIIIITTTPCEFFALM